MTKKMTVFQADGRTAGSGHGHKAEWFAASIRIGNRKARATLLFLLLCCWGLSGLYGCSKTNQDNDYLIRVGTGTVTVAEFRNAVDATAEEVFLGEEKVSPAAQHDLRMRVLNQLTEELLILERGKELGIHVSDEELNRAVAEIKADYPDDTFEKTLLENAVSFHAWKKKLATRILINKIIEKELVDKAEITSRDVADYFLFAVASGQVGNDGDYPARRHAA